MQRKGLTVSQPMLKPGAAGSLRMVSILANFFPGPLGPDAPTPTQMVPFTATSIPYSLSFLLTTAVLVQRHALSRRYPVAVSG